MAKTAFEVPELQEYPEIPSIQVGTMAHSQPFVAKPEFQAPLGFPGELAENWKEQALEAIAPPSSHLGERSGAGESALPRRKAAGGPAR